MIGVHRDIFASTPEGPAVILDTTFGFQVNADELVVRTQRYFAESVGREVTLASWRRKDDDPARLERTLAQISTATWVFAGPGSPTYALRHWRDTPLIGALLDVVRRGGTLVFGSAAAVTVGSHAVPVYEIYKAGLEPYWEEGLDLLSPLAGLRLTVIPHFDNAEGGTYDTRFCYLGERRLELLESMLPDDVSVLGVDEHTAVLLDFAVEEVHVLGNRTMTLRRRGRSRRFPAGTHFALREFRTALRTMDSDAPAHLTSDDTGARVPDNDSESPSGGAAETAGTVTSLREATVESRRRFDAALDRRDVEEAVDAILQLEQAIKDWSTDMLQSSDPDDARRELRSLVVRLGEFARAGAVDRRTLIAPFVTTLLRLRADARAASDYSTADTIRDRLLDAGIEVRDTPDGVEWFLAGEESAS